MGIGSAQGAGEQRIKIASLFQHDEDLKAMVCRFRRERSTFLEMFDQGFRHYIRGNWCEAGAIFFKIKKTQFYDGFTDQPTLTLLSHMDAYKFIAPDTWQGYRALTAK